MIVESEVAHNALRSARQHVDAIRFENGPERFSHGAARELILQRTASLPHIFIVGGRNGVAVVDEQREIGGTAFGGSIGVDREEIVGVESVALLSYFGEVAVIFLLIGSAHHGRIGAILHTRIHDVGSRHAPLLERGTHLQGFPQVGVALIESGGVAGVVVDSSHIAVVGAPAAMSGVDIDVGLVLGEVTAGQCHRCGSSNSCNGK